jgi:hypothetical protein
MWAPFRIKKKIKNLFLGVSKSDFIQTPQWKVFIQKSGQNFFIVKSLLFMVKIMILMILRNSRQFFGKICTGQFVGQNIGYIALITSH